MEEMITAEGLGLSRRTCVMLHAEMTGKAECFGSVLLFLHASFIP